MRIGYQGQIRHVLLFNEARITLALMQMINKQQAWVVFLAGHGEASIYDDSPRGLSVLARQWRRLGYQTSELDYRQIQALPDNADVLVLAAPTSDYSAQWVRQIRSFMQQGGDVFWLNQHAMPSFLGEDTALQLLPGVVVDAAAAKVGLDAPNNAIVTAFPRVLSAQGSPLQHLQFNSARAFAGAKPSSAWAIEAKLQTGQLSWNETGALKGQLQREAALAEQPGPLTIAYMLTAFENPSQRLAAVSNLYWLNNSQLMRADNLQLAERLLHWLTEYRLQPIEQDHSKLQVSWDDGLALATALWFTLGLPLLYLSVGVVKYRRRRNLKN